MNATDSTVTVPKDNINCVLRAKFLGRTQQQMTDVQVVNVDATPVVVVFLYSLFRDKNRGPSSDTDWMSTLLPQPESAEHVKSSCTSSPSSERNKGRELPSNCW